MDARDLLYGLPPAVIAQVAQVSLHTARRWKRRGRVPSAAYQLIDLVVNGELGALSRHWRGWTVRDGRLFTPEGWHVTPGEIRSIPVRIAHVRALEREREIPMQRALRFD